MKIEFNGTRLYSEIVVTDDNIKIEEVISETYIDKDGCKRGDITDDAIGLYAELLDQIMYDREREYFNESLTKEIFNKMPQQNIVSIIKELAEEYDVFSEGE